MDLASIISRIGEREHRPGTALRDHPQSRVRNRRAESRERGPRFARRRSDRYVTAGGNIKCVSRVRRGGFVFVTWVGDHAPRHVHVFGTVGWS